MPDLRVVLAFAGLLVGCGGSAASSTSSGTDDSAGGDIAAGRDTSSPATPALCRRMEYDLEQGEPLLVGSREWQFDGRGNLIRESRGHDDRTVTTRFEYGPDGSYSQQEDGYSYLFQVSEHGATRSVVKFEVDEGEHADDEDAAPPMEVQHTAYLYGPDGRVLEVLVSEDGMAMGTRCEYDAAGRLSRLVQFEGEPEDEMGGATFHYDEAGRLLRVDGSDSEEEFRTTVTSGAQGVELRTTIFDVDHEEGEDPFGGPPYRRSTLSAGCLALSAGSCSPMLAPPPPGGAPRYVLPL